MSDLLIWGVVLIIPVIVIITYILAQRYRVKMTVEKGLQESKSQPVTIIEAGSNFTTRMSDFKKNINRLNKAMDKRNEIISELRGNEKENPEESEGSEGG
jgi:hypothetical protein